MIGKTISTYRIVDLIGQGGMGVVYRAEDQKLGRTVALKFLPPELTRDEAARARFLNEARAASALDHRNVCVIHDIGETDDGQLYIIMPFYAGESLQDRIHRGALQPAEAIEVMLQIGAGLSRAHASGILHRDLKPANVLIKRDGEVRILDFGVAKLADGVRLTRSGIVVGTLCYMAPEQLAEESADARAEIWSLGVLLHEMLTGALPFRGRTQASLITAILQQRPDLGPLRAAAGDALTAIVERCLRRFPDERYLNVLQLMEDLERVRAGLGGDGRSLLGELRAADPRAGIVTDVFITPARNQPAVGPLPSTPALTAARPTFPVVAREEELGALLRGLEATLEPTVRVALVRGEEGRGKSTLVAELCRRAEMDDRFVCAIGSCNANAGAGDPYLPFREILSQLAGTLTGQEAPGRRTQAHLERIQRLMPHVAVEILEQGPQLVGTFVSGHELIERGRSLSGASAQWLQGIAELVKTRGTAEARRDPERGVLFDQYTRVLQRVARRQPLVLVLEDLHWADSGTVALLSHLARSLAAHAVLLVGTYRHEEVAHAAGGERHPLEAVIHELVRQFGDVVVDLDRIDGARFVTALLDSQPNRLDERFRARLLARTGGLPLFTTELLRELRDAEVLVTDRDGMWSLSGDVDWDVLPRRVEAVVAERLARLPDPLRGVLTSASVQGEEFTAEIVARVLGRDERETLHLLSNDAARRFRVITATGVRRIGPHRQSLYRFQHGVFQRYLYESLDEVERSLQHEDVATQMEALFGEREDEIVAQLAHHYLLAGVPDRAITYLQRAGERAGRLSANAEAIRFFESALEQLGKLPEGRSRLQRELDLRMGLVSVQIAVHGFGSAPVEATYLRARALCERLPEASDFGLLWGLFAFSAVRGEFERALPLARRMLESARKADVPQLLVQGHYAVGVCELFTGDLPAALADLQAATTPRDPELGKGLAVAFAQDSRKVAAAYTSVVRWLLADTAGSQAAVREALAWAREDVHPFTLSTALLLTGFARFFAGDVAALRAHGEEMATLSQRFELFQTTEAELLLALADVAAARSGEADGKDAVAGAQRLAAAIAAYRERGWTVFVPMLLGIEARTRLDAGQRPEAATALAAAWTIVEQGGESYWAPELLGVRADLAATPVSAAALRRQALELAKRQGSVWLELRAALAVARHDGERAPLAEMVGRVSPTAALGELAAATELLG